MLNMSRPLGDTVQRMIAIECGVLEHVIVDGWMKRMQAERVAGNIEDVVLFNEHPAVITVGRRAQHDGYEALAHIPHEEVDRGGGITYHGPGQLIVYPIIAWQGLQEQSVRTVTSRLEAWVIAAFADLGIQGRRDERMQGVWVDGNKIASIGLAFYKWVSRYGISINVTTEQGVVENLRGCGLEEGTSTSLSALGHTCTIDEMTSALFEHAPHAIHREIRRATSEEFTALAPLTDGPSLDEHLGGT